MASAAAPRLITATFHRPINASSNPTPTKKCKPPIQEAPSTTQVARSPPIFQKPEAITASQKAADSIVQDSLEQYLATSARQSIAIPDFLEPSPSHDDLDSVQDCYHAESVTSPPQNIARQSAELQLLTTIHPEDNVIRHHSVRVTPNEQSVSQPRSPRPSRSRSNVPSEQASEAHPPEHLEPDRDQDIQDCITVLPKQKTQVVPVSESSSHQAEDVYTPNHLTRSGTPMPNVSAITAFTTPTMAPKASSSTHTTSANQSRRIVNNSSNRSSQRVPKASIDIRNGGSTSSSYLLQQIKAGGANQANVTQLAPVNPPPNPSQNAPAQIAEASTKGVVGKRPARQHQTQPQSQKASGKRPESRSGALEELDLYYLPQSLGGHRANPGKKTKPTKKSALTAKTPKSQPKTKGVRALDLDDAYADEEYSAPKTMKAKSEPVKRETRASTRSQAKNDIKDDGTESSHRRGTETAAVKRGNDMPAPQYYAPSRISEIEGYEEFEDSVAHLNSGTALEPRSDARRQSTKLPLSDKRAAPRLTTKGAQLMAKLSSPDHNKSSIVSTTRKADDAQLRTPSHAVTQPTQKQGSTQKFPISIDDDSDESNENNDDENKLDSASYREYDEIINQTMRQEDRKQKLSSTKEPPRDAAESVFEQLSRQAEDIRSKQITDERTERKPNIVAFNDTGPKNQGISKSKPRDRTKQQQITNEASSSNPEAFNEDDSPLNHHSPHDLDDERNMEQETHTTTAEPLFPDDGKYVVSKLKPTITISDNAAVVVEVVMAKESPSAVLEDQSKAAASNANLPSVKPTRLLKESVRDIEDNEDFPQRFQPMVTTDIIDEPSKPLTKDAASFPERQREHPARISISLQAHEDKDLSVVRSLANSVMIGLNSPVLDRPQTLEEPGDRTRTADRTSNYSHSVFDVADDTLITNAHSKQQTTDRHVRTGTRRPPVPLFENVRIRETMLPPDLSPAQPHLSSPKRPSVEVDEKPAKRQKTRTDEQVHTTTRTSTVAIPMLRKSSQVTNEGSPASFGEEIPQKLILRTRHEKPSSTLVPSLQLQQEVVADSLAEAVTSKRKQSSGPELPKDEAQVPGQQLASQVIIPTGSNESPPLKIIPAQRSLGLMETLRSEVALGVAQDKGDQDGAKDSLQAEESGRDDDPDKTLVNEMSDDEESESESSNSSDTNDEDGPQSDLSRWRNALESHQEDVYGQLIRIAHNLTRHLVEHETAIEDIGKDYSQGGARLIARFEGINEDKLKQYRMKTIKMKEALIYGFKDTASSLGKDVKCLESSSERCGKISQVDAGAKLEQIMQSYNMWRGED